MYAIFEGDEVFRGSDSNGKPPLYWHLKDARAELHKLHVMLPCVRLSVVGVLSPRKTEGSKVYTKV